MQIQHVIKGLPSDLIDRYKTKLQQRSQHLLDRFERTVRDMPGAAHLEAITFAAMDQEFRLGPEIHDDPSMGGADFKLVSIPSSPIYQECKYVERGAVAAESGLDDSAPVDMEIRRHQQITGMLQTNVRSATRQLADCLDGPGIAVIGTDHADGGTVMSDYSIKQLMTSTPQLEVPISHATGSAVGPLQEVLHLHDSVFLAHPPRGSDDLARLRVPVSAVLLFWFDVAARWGTVIGCLNPWPLRPLDYSRFPGVPFARFVSIPTIAERSLPELEWVGT